MKFMNAIFVRSRFERSTGFSLCGFDFCISLNAAEIKITQAEACATGGQ
jgi:hypothetical protein